MKRVRLIRLRWPRSTASMNGIASCVARLKMKRPHWSAKWLLKLGSMQTASRGRLKISEGRLLNFTRSFKRRSKGNRILLLKLTRSSR